MSKVHLPARRRFFKDIGMAAAAGGAAASTLAAPAIASQDVRLRMATSWPKGAPGVGVNAERFAERLQAMTDGRIEVRVFAAGELVPPFEVLDAVSAGTADIAHATPYYWAGKSNALHFFTGIPFGLTAVECAAWLRFGGGQDLWDEVYEPFGVRAFYAGSSGTQTAGWFNKEIRSLEDLQGLNFRIAGLGGEAMRRLGVNTVLTPPGEIAPALASGAVDGVEWIGPWNDIAFGLHRMARFYYMPGVLEPGPGLEILVNRTVYDELPADLQIAIRAAAEATAFETLADFTYHNIVSFRSMLDEHDVEIRSFPEDVVRALWDKTVEILDELSAEDALFAKVRQSHDSFLAKARTYSPMAEEGMLVQRSLVAG